MATNELGGYACPKCRKEYPHFHPDIYEFLESLSEDDALSEVEYLGGALNEYKLAEAYAMFINRSLNEARERAEQRTAEVVEHRRLTLNKVAALEKRIEFLIPFMERCERAEKLRDKFKAECDLNFQELCAWRGKSMAAGIEQKHRRPHTGEARYELVLTNTRAERSEKERDKLAGDLAQTADWYQRMERAENALREILATMPKKGVKLPLFVEIKEICEAALKSASGTEGKV